MSEHFPLLHIQINANSAEELRHAVEVLRAQCDAANGGADYPDLAPNGESAKEVVFTQAPETLPNPLKTKTKKKKKTKAEAIAEVIAAGRAEAEAAEPSKQVDDHAPDKAREEGIKTLQSHMSENPGDIPKIKQLQDKYMVGMLSAVPDDKAHAFLADAKLVVAGVGLELDVE